ncbi:MAG: hypothetical protein GQF41_1813 [Candidatus Rifleibacterium amylolyticum]|nr:MAG: hypothetical protein GQF41_1813 [Candidatus Rifleibacterium amylolyticum]
MKLKNIVMVLTIVLSAICSVWAGETFLVEDKDGRSIITNDPVLASGARNVKPLGKPEGLVFPAHPQRRIKRPQAERILTGIFSGREEAGENPVSFEDTYLQMPASRQPLRQKTADTIAWMAEGSLVYHDPFLECATGTDRLWVDDIKDLSGLAPCEECFIKTAHAPEFIRNESGGLDLASAAELLTNQQFLVWAGERLPIKNPGFISTRRLLVYPKMEMTEAGLRQLAKEVEMAYRRHTWRVIEVLVKKSETDTDSISSFGEDHEKGSGDD